MASTFSWVTPQGTIGNAFIDSEVSLQVIATDFKNPRTSVNHKRTKRTFRSSKVRSTNSSCLLMSSAMAIILPNDCYVRVKSFIDRELRLPPCT